jgi:hypothetical protein
LDVVLLEVVGVVDRSLSMDRDGQGMVDGRSGGSDGRLVIGDDG